MCATARELPSEEGRTHLQGAAGQHAPAGLRTADCGHRVLDLDDVPVDHPVLYGPGI